MLMPQTDLQWDASLDSFDRAVRTQALHKPLIDFPAAPRASGAAPDEVVRALA